MSSFLPRHWKLNVKPCILFPLIRVSVSKFPITPQLNKAVTTVDDYIVFMTQTAYSSTLSMILAVNIQEFSRRTHAKINLTSEL